MALLLSQSMCRCTALRSGVSTLCGAWPTARECPPRGGRRTMLLLSSLSSLLPLLGAMLLLLLHCRE